MHPANLPLEELAKQCQVNFTRRKGPGGQHRNKVETAVVLTHLPSNVTAEANNARSQKENRVAAVWRLRLKLAIVKRTTRQLESSPGELLRSKLKSGKLECSVSHDDYPAVVAEVLDLLEHFSGDTGRLAEHLITSSSQILKLARKEDGVLRALNLIRKNNDLPGLK